MEFWEFGDMVWELVWDMEFWEFGDMVWELVWDIGSLQKKTFGNTQIQTYRNSIQATAIATQGWPGISSNQTISKTSNGTNACHVWETLGKINPTTPSFQPNIVHQ